MKEMTEQELREEAVKSVKEKREFRQHLIAFVIVNLAFVGMWAVTNSGGYFWPIWPMLGWGIGLTFHGVNTYYSPRITDAEIDREMKRLRGI
jgi:fatty acid desaturase